MEKKRFKELIDKFSEVLGKLNESVKDMEETFRSMDPDALRNIMEKLVDDLADDPDSGWDLYEPPYASGTFDESFFTEDYFGTIDASGVLNCYDDIRPKGEPIGTSISATSPCPDCNGSGKYVGLSSIDDCSKCQGKGKI